MLVVHKPIQVDFAPGEDIENAINDAMFLAAFTRTTVKFKFNGIPMTIDSADPLLLGYKFDTSPKKGWVKDIRGRVNHYVGEYHDKAEKRDLRLTKKFQKEMRRKKKTFSSGKDCATCEEECALRGGR